MLERLTVPEHTEAHSPSWLKKVLVADIRALAAFRISIALLFLLEIVSRAVDVKALFSDAGVFPFEVFVRIRPLSLAAIRLSETPGLNSLHFVSGSLSWQIAVFCFYFLVGLFLLFGKFSRTSCFVAWLCQLSLLNASAAMMYPGDYLMGVLLVAGSFAPLGECWSLDAQSQKAVKRPTQVYGLSLAPLFLTIFLFMLGSGISKNGPDWHSGEAVHHLLMSNQYATDMRFLLLPFPEICKLLTYSTLVSELILPFLLFVYGWNYRLRVLSIIGQIGLLLGLRIFVAAYLLSFITLTGLLPWLPSSFWEFLSRRFSVFKMQSGPSQPRNVDTPTRVVLASIFSVVMILLEWNRINSFGYDVARVEFPTAINSLLENLQLANRYRMFGNTAKKSSEYIIVHGTTESGRHVNLALQKDMSPTNPERYSIGDFSLRWRRYFVAIFSTKASNEYPHMRGYYADYVCRLWNQNHPTDKVNPDVEIIRMDDVFTGDSWEPTGSTVGFSQPHQCKMD